jgi:VanZ family protein
MRYVDYIKKAVFWGPVIAWMAVIFYFSAQPKGSPSLEHFPAPAGVGHFVGYAVLGFLLYRAFNGGLESWNRRAAGLAILTGFLYAVSDELHQLFVPGREAEVYDVMVDSGGVIGALLLIRVTRFMNFRKLKKIP